MTKLFVHKSESMKQLHWPGLPSPLARDLWYAWNAEIPSQSYAVKLSQASSIASDVPTSIKSSLQPVSLGQPD